MQNLLIEASFALKRGNSHTPAKLCEKKTIKEDKSLRKPIVWAYFLNKKS